MENPTLPRFERLKLELGLEGSSDDDLVKKLREERDALYGTDVDRQSQQDHNAASIRLRRTTGRRLILVREDNDLNKTLFRDVTELLLRCVTVATGDGDEALRIARLNEPDLIQSDIQGPNQSGLDFARLLKLDKRTSNIPLICVSASGSNPDKVLEAGFDAYMFKPINVAHYLDLIDSFLKQKPFTSPI